MDMLQNYGCIRHDNTLAILNTELRDLVDIHCEGTTMDSAQNAPL